MPARSLHRNHETRDSQASCHRDARLQRPADRRNTNAEAVDDETLRNNSQLNDGTLSSTEERAELACGSLGEVAQRELRPMTAALN